MNLTAVDYVVFLIFNPNILTFLFIHFLFDDVVTGILNSHSLYCNFLLFSTLYTAETCILLHFKMDLRSHVLVKEEIKNIKEKECVDPLKKKMRAEAEMIKN